MEDPEIQEIFDRFINNASIEDSVKIQKLKQLLIIFSNRWAEERTISSVGQTHAEIQRQVLRVVGVHRQVAADGRQTEGQPPARAVQK